MLCLKAPMAAALVAASLTVWASQDAPAIESVLPQDAIPSIDDPEFESAFERTGRIMADNELVIGLVGEREQRAYSTWQMDRHEIVNDVFEGQPVAVTWCPLCGTGIVYERDVGGRTLTFGVSGLLFKDALVMYDRETKTRWTQVDGHAIQGPLEGSVLRMVPSVHATWKEWRALYPDTRILRKRGEFRSAYDDYNRNPARLGIHGRRNVDARLPGKERILGIRSDGAATAFPLAAVREARLVEARVGSLAVVLVAPQPGLPVVAFERRVQQRDLTFRLEGAEPSAVLRDNETGSTWDIASGRRATHARSRVSSLLVRVARILSRVGRLVSDRAVCREVTTRTPTLVRRLVTSHSGRRLGRVPDDAYSLVTGAVWIGGLVADA